MNDQLRDLFSRLDTLPKTTRMPVIFVGHGSPLNAINGSLFAKIWHEVGTHLPTPRAIVCMSAHWLTDGTYASTKIHPELIYDFYGFPDELYHVEYPVIGNTDVAHELHVHADAIGTDDTRGLDHGVWTVLMHLFPTPHTIPVIALSIDYGHARNEQYTLMEKLKPLRDKGVLFIGSGNIVHNLMRMQHSGAHEWALEFDTLSKKLIEEKASEKLIDLESLGTAAQLAVPTDDHYRPMLNTLALMHAEETPLFFNESIDLGSVSMRSFVTI